jgi:hypothetical protein
VLLILVAGALLWWYWLDLPYLTYLRDDAAYERCIKREGAKVPVWEKADIKAYCRYILFGTPVERMTP